MDDWDDLPSGLDDSGSTQCAVHVAGFHSTHAEATACNIGGWWAGWPSVIPSGPPGSGATRKPVDNRGGVKERT